MVKLPTGRTFLTVVLPCHRGRHGSRLSQSRDVRPDRSLSSELGAGHRPADERDRAADRGSPGDVPLRADHGRPAGPRAHRRSHRPARRGGQAPGGRGLRPEEAAEVEPAGSRALLRVLGVPDPRDRLHRGVRRAVQRRLRDPGDRPLGRARLPPGLHRADGARRHHHVRDHPAAQLPRAPRPSVAVQGLAPHGCLGRAVHDLQRHLVAVPVPRRGLGAGQPALRQWRLRVDRHRQPARRAQSPDAGGPGGHRPAAAHRRHAGVPRHRRALQAPPHLRRAAQRDVRPPADGPGRGRADDVGRQAGHHGGPRGARRGRPARHRRGRGLHLEGPARLRDLHRVRPLPVAVPGVEHREAAVAEDADPRPARPRVREGAVHPGRRGRPRRAVRRR